MTECDYKVRLYLIIHNITDYNLDGIPNFDKLVLDTITAITWVVVSVDVSSLVWAEKVLALT